MSSIDAGLAKVLEQNAALAVKADTNKAPIHTTLPGFPRHILHLWNFKSGTLDQVVAPPAPRDYHAGTVEAVAALINEFTTNPALGLPAPSMATTATEAATKPDRLVFVWIKNGQVRVVLDEAGDRRERIGLYLNRSQPFLALLHLEGEEWVDQKRFVMALRVDINGMYYPAHIVDTIRDLKWTRNETGESAVQTGRYNFGTRVEAKISGVDEKDLREIEDLRVSVPVYSDLFNSAGQLINSTFDCAVDVHPTDQAVILKIKAGEVDRVLRQLDTAIADMIAEKVTSPNVKIFFGEPRD